MADRLEEIEARAKAATRGPWRTDWNAKALPDGTEPCIVSETPAPDEPADDPTSKVVVGTGGCGVDGLLLREADGDFIAHARADVPWLVAQVRERDAEIARLRAEVARLKSECFCPDCGDQTIGGEVCRDCDLDRLRASRAEPVEVAPVQYGPTEFMPHPAVELSSIGGYWCVSVLPVTPGFDSASDAVAWLREQLAGVEAALAGPVSDRLARNIADLRALSDGWLDGDGLAPDRETLDWLGKTMPRWVAGGVPVPVLCPTEDGFVRAEWPVGADGVDASAEFHACVVRAPPKEVAS